MRVCAARQHEVAATVARANGRRVPRRPLVPVAALAASDLREVGAQGAGQVRALLGAVADHGACGPPVRLGPPARGRPLGPSGRAQAPLGRVACAVTRRAQLVRVEARPPARARVLQAIRVARRTTLVAVRPRKGDRAI